MPWPINCRLLCSELDTAPSIRDFIRARPSMKNATVEPVPTPTTLPSSTNSSAFSAASFFCASRDMAAPGSGGFEREDALVLRGGDRQHRQPVAALQQREF